jgi:hypothetical protein
MCRWWRNVVGVLLIDVLRLMKEIGPVTSLGVIPVVVVGGAARTMCFLMAELTVTSQSMGKRC